MSEKMKDECDVVVRGSWKVGLVACLEAAKNDAKVLYLEEDCNDAKVHAFKVEMLQ